MNPSAIFLRDMKPATPAARPQAQARPAFSLPAGEDGEATPPRTDLRERAAERREAGQARREAERSGKNDPADDRANGRGRPDAPSSRRSARADEVSNRDKTKHADGKPVGGKPAEGKGTDQPVADAATPAISSEAATSPEAEALAALAAAQKPDDSTIAQVIAPDGEGAAQPAGDATAAAQAEAAQMTIAAEIAAQIAAQPAILPANAEDGPVEADTAAIAAEGEGKAKTAGAALPAVGVSGKNSALPGQSDAAEAEGKPEDAGVDADAPGKGTEAKDTQDARKDAQTAAGKPAQAAEGKPESAGMPQPAAQRLEPLPQGLASLPENARALQAQAADGKPGAGTQPHGPRVPETPPTSLAALPIEIGFRALSGSKRFDIRLDPPELGRVDVTLSFDKEGEVTAKLTVERVETLHLLQRDARTLERAFDQAGLRTSDAGIQMSLSDRNAGQGGGFQAEEQRARGGNGRDEPEAKPQITDLMPPPRRMRLGGVDLNI